jgi:O-antigen/teichoic acid export membrane protein
MRNLSEQVPVAAWLQQRLVRNIASNYLSVIWLGGLTLALIPWYTKLLGPQQWGLVAVCISFQGFMTLLDAGLTQIMPRDIAKASDSLDRVAGIFHIFSRAYILLGITGCLLGQLAAPWIAMYWLHSSSEMVDEATWALRIVLLQFVFQFGNNAHIGYWNGIQSQAVANLRQCLFGSAKHLGALTLMHAWHGSAIAYLLPFAMISALEYASNRRAVLAGLISKAPRPVSQVELISLARESGVMAISVLIGMLISQIDRIILSGHVAVSEFGRYVIVANLGLAFMQLQHPLVRAFLPRLVNSASNQASRTMRQMVVAISLLCVLPCAGVGLFAPYVLRMWINDPVVVMEGTLPLRLILSAVAINSLYQIIYQRMLVHGLARLIFRINIVILIVILPFSVFVVTRYGINGGGFIWVAISTLQVMLGWIFIRKAFK